jgi:hypothetical protein
MRQILADQIDVFCRNPAVNERHDLSRLYTLVSDVEYRPYRGFHVGVEAIPPVLGIQTSSHCGSSLMDVYRKLPAMPQTVSSNL